MMPGYGTPTGSESLGESDTYNDSPIKRVATYAGLQMLTLRLRIDQ